MKLNKMKNGVFIFLGISVLLGAGFISSGLSEVAESISQQDTPVDDSQRMIVQDGVIYMYDTITGEVWKKEDIEEAKWEEVKKAYEY